MIKKTYRKAMITNPKFECVCEVCLLFECDDKLKIEKYIINLIR